jgi:multidrug transporter EmrE-like cation transporter
MLYGLGALAWLRVLANWEVSKAYPFVGLGFAFTMGIGLIVGEHLTLLRLSGVALICAGVFLVSQS